MGLLESFASFWASSLKETIVFTFIIPVLLWRSLARAIPRSRTRRNEPVVASCWRSSLVALVAAPLVLPEFYVTLLDYIGLATLVVLGLVVMTGVAGIVSFGQQAFVGIAAYTTAGLTTLAGWSPWAGLAGQRSPASPPARC